MWKNREKWQDECEINGEVKNKKIYVENMWNLSGKCMEKYGNQVDIRKKNKNKKTKTKNEHMSW